MNAAKMELRTDAFFTPRIIPIIGLPKATSATTQCQIDNDPIEPLPHRSISCCLIAVPPWAEPQPHSDAHRTELFGDAPPCISRSSSPPWTWCVNHFVCTTRRSDAVERATRIRFVGRVGGEAVTRVLPIVTADCAFRLRSSSYGGQVGSNPPCESRSGLRVATLAAH